MGYGILFPGQGSQAIGMGRGVFLRSPDINERASKILGWDLEELIMHGSEDDLTPTERAQPALFVVALGMWDILRSELDNDPAGAAGHSLGEYTALAAAGALNFEQGLRLVAARGRAMASAATLTPSSMAALLGADFDTAEAICRQRRDEGGSLWVANLNAPGQIVVAGATADVHWLTENARSLGVKRAVPLKVAGGFHTPLMQPAADALETMFETEGFSTPQFPVWSNVDAAPIEAIGSTLLRQISGTVRFADSLRAMWADGIDTFVHVGPGDVTAAMARRTVPDATVLTVSTVDDIVGVAPIIRSQAG